MSANRGLLILGCRFFQFYDTCISDTQILAMDEEAKRQFGGDMTQRYMSDLQSEDWRAFGHERYWARKAGEKMSASYAVMITRPDGKHVGQVRTFGRWLDAMPPHHEAYIAYVEEVKEVDHDPTIRSGNFNENNDFTVSQFRDALVYDDLPLALRTTFPHIISRCEELSSGLFAKTYATPLDLALSADISFSLPYAHSQDSIPQGTPMVRQRFSCQYCGKWMWFGRADKRAKCTGCKKHFNQYREGRSRSYATQTEKA